MFLFLEGCVLCSYVKETQSAFGIMASSPPSLQLSSRDPAPPLGYPGPLSVDLSACHHSVVHVLAHPFPASSGHVLGLDPTARPPPPNRQRNGGCGQVGRKTGTLPEKGWASQTQAYLLLFYELHKTQGPTAASGHLRFHGQQQARDLRLTRAT